MNPSTLPNTAGTAALIPPAINALTGSCPVTTATAAPPAALPTTSEATFWAASLDASSAYSSVPAYLPAADPAALPTYDPTSCMTYDLAVASSTSPTSPPFAATDAPSMSGSAHALPVLIAAIFAMVVTGSFIAASMTSVTVDITGSITSSITQLNASPIASPTPPTMSPTMSMIPPPMSSTIPSGSHIAAPRQVHAHNNAFICLLKI